MTRPRLVGINHVAIEVGDIEEALAFYGQTEAVLRGMHLELGKTERALEELRAKGIEPAAD